MLVSSDGESWKLTGQEATVVPFPEAGIFTFTGTTQDGTAGTLTVKVCAGFLPRVLDTLHGTTRTMTLNADQAVTFETARDLANLSVTRSGKASATLGLLPLVARELGLVARMGIGGPILAVQPVNVIGFTDAKLNSMTSQSASNIAGYKLYSTPLTVTNLPEGGRVDISIFRAGVMFPNGSTVRSVYPKDLTNGSVVLQFLYPLGMPGAFCHHLLIYDRVGKYLGTR